MTEKNDCFAWSGGSHRNACAALKNASCEGCRFYKKKEDLAEQLERCSYRLRNLGCTEEAERDYSLYLSYFRAIG